MIKSKRKKSKTKKRPTSHNIQKTRLSQRIAQDDYSLSDAKNPFFHKIYIKNNNISKEQITERKLNNDLNDLSLVKYIKEITKKKEEKIETPKKIIYKKKKKKNKKKKKKKKKLKIKKKIKKNLTYLDLWLLIIINQLLKKVKY